MAEPIPPSASFSPSCSGRPSDKTPTKTRERKKIYRGAGFTPLEDAAIAKAWITVSENSILGTEQKADDFMQQVADFYNESFKPANRESRTPESIRARSKAIHKECMLFSGCYARVVRAMHTGVSARDLISMATALLNGVEMSEAQEDYGKPFRFLSAWEVLRHHEKFAAAMTASTSAAESSKEREKVDESDAKTESVPLVERPIGRRRAKEALHKNEDSKKKLRLAVESVAAQKERNETLKRHYEIMLFTNAPAGCDESEAVEYFSIMRARALSNLRGNKKRKNADSATASNYSEREDAAKSGE